MKQFINLISGNFAALLRSAATPNSVVATVMIVAFGSGLSLLLFLVSARLLGPLEFGYFATWFNAALFVAAIAPFGQDNLIVRSWNEYLKSGRYEFARGALNFGALVTFAGIALSLVGLYICWLFFDWPIWLTFAGAALIIVQSLGLFTCHAARAVVGIWTGDGHGQITWRALAIILIVAIWSTGLEPRAADFLALIAFACAISLLIQAVTINRHLPLEVAKVAAEYKSRMWAGRSGHMWGAAILEASSRFLDVFLVGILLGPMAAGGYFVVTRIANVFLKILSSAHIYSSRTISELYYGGQQSELLARLRSLSLFNLTIVSIGMILVLVAGELMLLVFGETYLSQYPSLMVLCPATAFMALGGPAPTLLMLVGQERNYMWGIAAGLVVRVILLAILAPQFGVLGAAIAWSVAAVATTIGLNIVCRRNVGIDPSCLNLLYAKQNAGTAKTKAELTLLSDVTNSEQSADRDSPEPFNVLFIQTQSESGGAQEITRILTAGLRARGINARQLFLFQRTSVFEADKHSVCCLPERPSGPLGFARLLITLFREIRRQKPDAVLCFQHYGNIIAGPVARLAGCPVVVANRVSALETMPRWVRYCEAAFTRFAVFTRMVVNSAQVEAEYAGHSNAIRKRLYRIDHGFDPKLSTLDKSAARRQLSLPEDVQLIGSVARLHPLKNLEAAVDLLPHNDRWHVAIAGDGAGRADLEQRARDLGCADRLHLLGEKSPADIAVFYAALDLFVFPTLAETFGLAAVEAARAGVPIVANDLAVLREVLEIDGEPCAVFADSTNPAAFRNAVERVISVSELSAKLTRNGPRLQEKYSCQSMIDAYADLNASLCGRPELVT